MISFIQKSSVVTQPSSYVIATTSYNESQIQYMEYLNNMKQKITYFCCCHDRNTVCVMLLFDTFSLSDIVKKGLI